MGDGLAGAAGMDTWTSANPTGCTVEMHGCIQEVVCPCGERARADSAVIKRMKSGQAVVCGACGGEDVRWRVLMYGEPDHVQQVVVDAGMLELLADDVSQVDLIIWAGISFEQSATTQYFKAMQRALVAAGRQSTPIAIVNPSSDAMWNIRTAVFNCEELDIFQVCTPSDEVIQVRAPSDEVI